MITGIQETSHHVWAIHFKDETLNDSSKPLTTRDLNELFILFKIHYTDIHYLRAHQNLSQENMLKLGFSKWLNFIQ